jgi:hypothetical protein
MESVTRFWSHEAQNIRCVRESDFDRVAAESLALQQRLTVQDQREDDLKGFLRVALLAAEDMEDIHGDNGDTSSARSMRDLVDKINAALKPTAEAESRE